MPNLFFVFFFGEPLKLDLSISQMKKKRPFEIVDQLNPPPPRNMEQDTMCPYRVVMMAICSVSKMV